MPLLGENLKPSKPYRFAVGCAVGTVVSMPGMLLVAALKWVGEAYGPGAQTLAVIACVAVLFGAINMHDPRRKL